MNDGPRLLAEKIRQRISKTYGVPLASIEEWWYRRQSSGGKLCSPRKSKRGGKLAEFEDAKMWRMSLGKWSLSDAFTPSDNLFETHVRRSVSDAPFSS
jgi:hypothetical protein